MKKILIFLCIFFGLSSFVFANNILPAERAIVTSIEYVDTPNVSGGDSFETLQKVTVKILSGQFKNEQVVIDNMMTGNPLYDIFLSIGDRLILHTESNVEFVEDINDVSFYIADIQRTNAIYFFIAIFFSLLFFIGKRKGLLSFIAILATVALIFFMLTPMILSGVSPVIATMLVSLLATVITIYLVAGFNYKSTSAVLGTAVSVQFAGLLSLLAIKVASLTGFAGDEAMFLYSARPDLDFTGILSASIMLAALGAVMDVGVSIASTINEIYETDKSLGIKDLFKSGMNVGRDIIGTMSNTLILVYLGASLPLVLLFSNIDIVKFFNLNLVATEILSALIGSIAILTCVPITAIISAYAIKTFSREKFDFDNNVNVE